MNPVKPLKDLTNRYDATSIQVLEGLEPVKKRPAMYIGDTSEEGLHHLLTEIINNSVDEALASYCNAIWVIFNDDESVTVVDNGRGIPVDEMPHYKKSALEIVMTTLHAGGKFGTEGYKISGGLHGVGASVVNALSENCEVIVKRNGKYYHQNYKRGEPKSKVEELASPPSSFLFLLSSNSTGTLVTFKPDPQIFGSKLSFDFERVKKQLRYYAFLTAELKFILIDQRKRPINRYEFYFEGGLKSFIKYLNRGHNRLQDEPFYVNKDLELNGGQLINVEVAVQYNDEFHEDVLSFANNIETHEGGYHETGFRAALTRSINEYARKQNILKGDNNLTAEDVREGLTAVISVKIPATVLQFEGQTKRKLGNSEVRPLVESTVREALLTYFEENPSEARAIIGKSLLAQEARVAAKKARETVQRKSALISSALPGKLADCQIKDATKAELYVVEGPSAGGSAKQARDRKFQAILPLTGKPINTEKARLDKVLANEKLKDLLIALGCGVGEDLDLQKLRYHRIILMNDADVDGEHITTLVLTFFYRQLKELIEKGFIYVAQPPLYRIQKGKTVHYVYSDEEKEQKMKEAQPESKAATKAAAAIKIQRFKGLGEMNPEQLWETTMNPQSRILKQIQIEDATEADAIFTMLMGEEVPPRKKFIQTHAKEAELDV